MLDWICGVWGADYRCGIGIGWYDGLASVGLLERSSCKRKVWHDRSSNGSMVLFKGSCASWYCLSVVLYERYCRDVPVHVTL